MMKKRVLASVLVLVLAMTCLVGCGDKKEEESEPTTLSGKVNIAALEGIGADSTKNLGGDYKVSVCKDSLEIEEKVMSSQFDAAIMSPTSAGILNEKTSGELVEVSPVSLGGIAVIQNGYVQGVKTVRVFNEETKLNEYKEEPVEPLFGMLRGKTIVAYGQPNDFPMYVLQQLARKEAGMIINPDQFEWIADKDEFIDRMGDYNVIGLATEPVLSQTLKKQKSVKVVFDLEEKWKLTNDGEIPSNVLVVSKQFLKDRPDDVKIMLRDYGEAIGKSKESGDKHSVLYTESNRGINILKKFNEVLYSFSGEAYGGMEPQGGFYYKR